MLFGFPQLLGFLETRAHGQILMIYHIVSVTNPANQKGQGLATSQNALDSLPEEILSYGAGLHAKTKQIMEMNAVLLNQILTSDLLKGNWNERMFSIAVHFFRSACNCPLRREGLWSWRRPSPERPGLGAARSPGVLVLHRNMKSVSPSYCCNWWDVKWVSVRNKHF